MMESAADEQDKLPDMVFKYADEFYIVEIKNMKGGGGGQNKQIVEVINFIRYAEQNRHVHYVTFLDGEYSNLLHKSQQRKIRLQREDIVGCLTRNPGNYFVNTAGFMALLDSCQHLADKSTSRSRF